MIRPVAAFSIRVASKMSGTTPELLRAWERRYGLIRPQRAGNGRRLYSKDDVEHLKELKAAVDAGHPIGNIAGLPRADLRGLGGHLPASAEPQTSSIDPEADLEHLAATLSPRDFVLQVAAPLQGKPVKGANARHVCASLLRTLRRTGSPDLLIAGRGLLPAVLAAAHGRIPLYVGSDIAPEQAAKTALDISIPTALVVTDDPREAERFLLELPPQVEAWVMGGAAPEAPPHAIPFQSLDELDRELG